MSIRKLCASTTVFIGIFSALSAADCFCAPNGDKSRTEDALRADVEFLSDSLCQGRGAGTGGKFIASRAIWSRMKGLGLDPQVQLFNTVTGTSAPAGSGSKTGASAAAGNGGTEAGQNIIGERREGRDKKWIVVLAYYDGLSSPIRQAAESGTTSLRSPALLPGADCNASGVAAMLALADSLRGRNVVFAALDAHNRGNAGAKALKDRLSGRQISMVVSLEIIGSSMAPVRSYLPSYLIALGAKSYKPVFDKMQTPLVLSYDYYGNAGFTDFFYRKTSDLGPFLSAGLPGVLFTSGITYNTNKETDVPSTLDYGMMAERVSLIARWIQKL